MSLQGFYTTKGLALAAKIAAGTKLTITKVTAGSGTTGESASALAQERQTLAVGTAETGKQTATLPVTLAEINAAASYSLTELGVYARDPDVGELLYQVFRMDEPRSITAGGENVCRFYLNQTIGKEGITVTCSPAGLLVDEDLAPVREKVFAASTPSRTVTVAAAELPAYINALPRLLNEALTINISSGTVPEGLKINGFYGNGRLNLQPANGASVQIPHGIYVTYCTAYIYLSNLTVSGEGYVAGADSALIFVRTANVGISQCTITGNDNNYGVVIAYQSIGHINSCSITHTAYAVQVNASSISGVYNCTGSNNRIGIRTAYGAAAMLSGTTPELMGGTANDKLGPIFKGSTLL